MGQTDAVDGATSSTTHASPVAIADPSNSFIHASPPFIGLQMIVIGFKSWNIRSSAVLGKVGNAGQVPFVPCAGEQWQPSQSGRSVVTAALTRPACIVITVDTAAIAQSNGRDVWTAFLDMIVDLYFLDCSLLRRVDLQKSSWVGGNFFSS